MLFFVAFEFCRSEPKNLSLVNILANSRAVGSGRLMGNEVSSDLIYNDLADVIDVYV